MMVVFAAVHLPGAANPEGDKEQNALVGVWELVEMQLGERKLPKDQIPPGKICFTGKEYLSADNVMPVAGSYRIDTTKQPHMISCTAYNGDAKGKTEVMHYEINNDKLTIINRLYPGEPRKAIFKRLKP
jgi:uncharacterized protein (TIGR03067 family)